MFALRYPHVCNLHRFAVQSISLNWSDELACFAIASEREMQKRNENYNNFSLTMPQIL